MLLFPFKNTVSTADVCLHKAVHCGEVARHPTPTGTRQSGHGTRVNRGSSRSPVGYTNLILEIEHASLEIWYFVNILVLKLLFLGSRSA